MFIFTYELNKSIYLSITHTLMGRKPKHINKKGEFFNRLKFTIQKQI